MTAVGGLQPAGSALADELVPLHRDGHLKRLGRVLPAWGACIQSDHLPEAVQINATGVCHLDDVLDGFAGIDLHVGCEEDTTGTEVSGLAGA